MSIRITRSLMVVLFMSLFLFACIDSDEGGDDSEESRSEYDGPATYSVYVGEIAAYDDSDNLKWKWKEFLGTGEGTKEFDLAAAGLTTARDIEIVSDGMTLLDAAENLQTGGTIGFNGDGTSAGFYIDGGGAAGRAGLGYLGPADGLGGEVPKDNPIIFRLGGSNCNYGVTDITDGPGNDLKINIASQLYNLPYQGDGSAISDADKEAIRSILSELVTGYKTENKSLILQHIVSPIKEQISSELDTIFEKTEIIRMEMHDYEVVGNLPYAEIQHVADYENVYSVEAAPQCGSWGDALFFFFEKIDGAWKIYYIAPAFNYHVSLLDCALSN